MCFYTSKLRFVERGSGKAAAGYRGGRSELWRLRNTLKRQDPATSMVLPGFWRPFMEQAFPETT